MAPRGLLLALVAPTSYAALFATSGSERRAVSITAAQATARNAKFAPSATHALSSRVCWSMMSVTRRIFDTAC
ncbi:hypothetical protein C8T65DRAFT_666074 [Cerioporus squamosus]|nr:hypothetical protein C8T65DRAFT_666074 [Cerioporus squamosus]